MGSPLWSVAMLPPLRPAPLLIASPFQMLLELSLPEAFWGQRRPCAEALGEPSGHDWRHKGAAMEGVPQDCTPSSNSARGKPSIRPRRVTGSLDGVFK